MKKLISEYRKRRPEIKKRLEEFSLLHKGLDGRIFSELCFCILTANANALACNEAINDLERSGLLLRGRASAIKKRLKGRARFHNKKALFIVSARNLFKKGNGLEIKKHIDLKDIIATRDWFVRNIKGYGYKEASHFLRNVGLGRDLAILDRHILKNLRKYGVIKAIPASVGSRKAYLNIEEKMRKFSKSINIPLPDLDLLFWSLQTGFIFK